MIIRDLFTHKTFAKLATEVRTSTIFQSAFKRRNILFSAQHVLLSNKLRLGNNTESLPKLD